MAKKLWGGRFSKKTNPLVEEFTKSISYDYKLSRYDCLGSLLHVEVLKKAGYLKSEEARKLSKALEKIYKTIENGTFKPDEASEDIHTDIQNKLYAKVGNLALKLHTARSRNDQVVFATKLYCNYAILDVQEDIAAFMKAILRLGEGNKNIIIPGFTHLQHAQPVYLKDYLGAYLEMVCRDEARLETIYRNLKLQMGAGALAGTPIAADKYEIKAARLIKKWKIIGGISDLMAPVNSLDAVSDRDFAIEIISALAILAMHLSRLAEDLIIFSSAEFDFVEIDEAFCTGSSLMPQKKNPDVLELIRGYSARIYGNLISVLAMMKGLPLAYNRDMQLDKEPLFNSFELVSQELKILGGLIETLKFNKEKIAKSLEDEPLYATDIVYYLVDKKIPFKEAHTIVGKLVKYSIANSVKIKDLPENSLKKFCGKFVKTEIIKLFNPIVSVESKRSILRPK